MYFKDYNGKKKSITVTALVLTFLLTVGGAVALVFGFVTDSSILWALLGFHAPYIALYWNKRVRASSGGFEFLDEKRTSETFELMDESGD